MWEGHKEVRTRYVVLAICIFAVSVILGYLDPSFQSHYDSIQPPIDGDEQFLEMFLIIFLNNSFTAALAIFSGLLFGIGAVVLCMINGYFIGTVFHGTEFSLPQVLLRILPHGVFELPAIILAFAAGLSLYDLLLKDKKIERLKKSALLLVRVIIPLIFLAACIETLLIQFMPLIISYEEIIFTLFRNIILAFLFYGVLKAFKKYLKERETREILILAVLLLVASDIWLYTYDSELTDFIKTFDFVTYSAPLLLLLAYLYLERKTFLVTKDKKQIAKAFEHYVSAAVIAEMLKEKEINLGGQKKNLTIMISDLRGFTTLSERVEPTTLVRILNHYLDTMTNVIMDRKGVVDKFIGDSIMAFWGAPVHEPDHPILACEAALQMQAEMHRVNLKTKEEGLPPLRMGLAITTGDVIVGNMGSNRRFDYTVIGDPVNLASRLEGLNKIYKTGILLTEQTYLQVKDQYLCRMVDQVRVKGKSKVTRIYELRSRVHEATDLDNAIVQQFAKAYTLYQKKDWRKALSAFSELAKHDPVSEVFAKRCRAYLEKAPANWDGVFRVMTK